MKKFLSGILVGALALHLYHRQSMPPVQAAEPVEAEAEAEAGPLAVAGPPPDPEFRCDGREHCRQMRSCGEARFFLENCPDVKMDGDGDGRPCEEGPC